MVALILVVANIGEITNRSIIHRTTPQCNLAAGTLKIGNAFTETTQTQCIVVEWCKPFENLSISLTETEVTTHLMVGQGSLECMFMQKIMWFDIRVINPRSQI